MSIGSDLFDKLIIALLVITLPVAILLTATYQEAAPTQPTGNNADLQGIDQTIESIKAEVAVQKSERALPIVIDDVSYATSSGELRIEGTAPNRNLNVMVSAVILPMKEQTKTVDKTATKSSTLGASTEKEPDTTVLGQSVEVLAVKANESGKFSFVKKIDTKKTDIVELQFDQGKSTVTIQYSISKNKRVL